MLTEESLLFNFCNFISACLIFFSIFIAKSGEFISPTGTFASYNFLFLRYKHTARIIRPSKATPIAQQIMMIFIMSRSEEDFVITTGSSSSVPWFEITMVEFPTCTTALELEAAAVELEELSSWPFVSSSESLVIIDSVSSPLPMEASKIGAPKSS